MYQPTAKQFLQLFFALSTLFIFSATSIANTSNELPVKFVRFEVKQIGDIVNLKWLTDSEYDNAFFTVERSTDGTTWQALEQIEALGVTPGGGTYEYVDANPVIGESLYRIKQTDFDGGFDYSHEAPITVTEFSGEAEVDLQVYPNPVPGSVVTVSSEIDLSYASVKMIDIAGRETPINTDINDTAMVVEIENPVSGIYFLIIRVGSKSIVEQLKFE